MLHVGDITKLSGYELEIPDVVTGGSPCQGLSVAGKGKGLADERSGLFMEQIRLVKELRDASAARADEHIRPRYMVWENVAGATSSTGGEDFRIVLEETARIICKDAVIPRPEKGKWRNTGCIMGDGWSIAWRIHDAQFWGVPQRRRRISLVADFGGQSAPEILFERKGMSWHSSPRGEARGEANAAAASGGVAIPIHDKATRFKGGGGTRRDDGAGNGLGIGSPGDPCPTLDTNGNHAVFVPQTLKIRSGCEGGGKGALVQDDLSATLSCNNDQVLFVPAVAKTVRTRPGASFREDSDTLIVAGFCGKASKGAGSIGYQEEVAPSLRAGQGMHVFENHAQDSRVTETDISPTCSSKWGTGGNNTPLVTTYQDTTGPLMANTHPGSYSGQDAYQDMFVVAGIDCRNGVENGDLCGTLQAHDKGGYSLNCTHPVRINHYVRRLTPLECERLQGFPDGWTDIPDYTYGGKKRKASDSARYRALGNSIALPFWKWLLKRISAQYERDATLGSLFDGLGGFPYLWEQINGKGSALWASEIEGFAIAVTEYQINGRALCQK